MDKLRRKLVRRQNVQDITNVSWHKEINCHEHSLTVGMDCQIPRKCAVHRAPVGCNDDGTAPDGGYEVEVSIARMLCETRSPVFNRRCCQVDKRSLDRKVALSHEIRELEQNEKCGGRHGPRGMHHAVSLESARLKGISGTN